MSNTYKRATFGIGPFIGGFQNTMYKNHSFCEKMVDPLRYSRLIFKWLGILFKKKKNVYVPDYIKYGILLKTAKKQLKEVICGVK